MPEKLGDATDTELTEARAKSVAGDKKQIILTFVNKVRLDFAKTWAYHVVRLGLTNYLIGATDVGALTGLHKLNLPCFSMRTNLPDVEWDWGSPSFKALGQHKVELIFKALTWGLEVVITDSDALVLREPFSFMTKFPEASFLTTSDCLGNTSGSADGHGLEDHGCLGQAFNIGYMYFKPSALPLVKPWLMAIRRNPRGTWDQATFNTLARASYHGGGGGSQLQDKRLFSSYAGGVVGGILPLSLFAGGHTHFVSRMAWRANNAAPYSVHTTFQYGGAPGKRHRLREAMLWHDSEDYYHPIGGVLTYDASIPEEMLTVRTPNGHIDLMLHQLRQMRAALAISHTLGRKLVLPQLACGMDKYWAPLNRHGVIPGAYAWAMPCMACPLDHMLNPAEFKPNAAAHVREYSFLQNPRMTKSFASGINKTSINVKGGSAEAARLKSFSAVRGVHVLHLTNLAEVADELWLQQPHPEGRRGGGGGRRRAGRRLGLFGIGGSGGLLTDDEWGIFRSAFSNLQGGWCCAPRGQKPHAAGFHLLRAPPHPNGRGSSGRRLQATPADGSSVGITGRRLQGIADYGDYQLRKTLEESRTAIAQVNKELSDSEDLTRRVKRHLRRLEDVRTARQKRRAAKGAKRARKEKKAVETVSASQSHNEAAAEQKRARKERRNRRQEKKAVEQAKAEATIRPQATKRLLVLGIISNPRTPHVREWIRNTYITSASQAQADGKVLLRFVMGRRGLNEADQRKVHAENSTHHDIEPIDASDFAVRGGIFSCIDKLFAWFPHAAQAYPGARFYAKADDDSYVDIKRLLGLLGPLSHVTNAYLGYVQYDSFIVDEWKHCGWSSGPVGAAQAHRSCPHKNGPTQSYGPFPFVVGALTVLGNDLANYMVKSTWIRKLVAEGRESQNHAVKHWDCGYSDVTLGYAFAKSNLSVSLVSVRDAMKDATYGAMKGEHWVVSHHLRNEAQFKAAHKEALSDRAWKPRLEAGSCVDWPKVASSNAEKRSSKEEGALLTRGDVSALDGAMKSFECCQGWKVCEVVPEAV